MLKSLLTFFFIIFSIISAQADDGILTPAIKLVAQMKTVWDKLPSDKQQNLLNTDEYKRVCNFQLQTAGVEDDKMLSYSQITQIMELYGDESDQAKAVALIQAAIEEKCK